MTLLSVINHNSCLFLFKVTMNLTISLIHHQVRLKEINNFIVLIGFTQSLVFQKWKYYIGGIKMASAKKFVAPFSCYCLFLILNWNKKCFAWEKSSVSRGKIWGTNMASLSSLRGLNMAAMMPWLKFNKERSIHNQTCSPFSRL